MVSAQLRVHCWWWVMSRNEIKGLNFTKEGRTMKCIAWHQTGGPRKLHRMKSFWKFFYMDHLLFDIVWPNLQVSTLMRKLSHLWVFSLHPLRQLRKSQLWFRADLCDTWAFGSIQSVTIGGSKMFLDPSHFGPLKLCCLVVFINRGKGLPLTILMHFIAMSLKRSIEGQLWHLFISVLPYLGVYTIQLASLRSYKWHTMPHV